MYSKKRSYSRISGRGLYKNSLVGGSTAVIPTFNTARDETGALHITHKEYICDIQGSSTFQIQNYLINPGNQTLFPWLAQIAQNYDEYEFKGLVFHFRSTCSDNSTSNAQLGTLIMAANYNANASNFANKQQMMEYDGASSVKISSDMQFGVECDPTKNGMSAILYIAPNGTAPQGEDAKTYHLANLQIATNSSQNTGQVGELWATYKVTLRKPKYCVTNALCQPFLEHYNSPLITFSPLTTVTTNWTANTTNDTAQGFYKRLSPGIGLTAPTETNRYYTKVLTAGTATEFLDVTPRLSLSDGPGQSATNNGVVTNITNGRSGLNSLAFGGMSTANTLADTGFSFRFPDALGSGTYLFNITLNGIDVSALTPFPDSFFAAISSQNVLLYGINCAVDITTSDLRGVVITFKAQILQSAFAFADAIDNTTVGKYTTVPHGTWAGLAVGNHSWLNTGTVTKNEVIITINQLNPAVTI